MNGLRGLALLLLLQALGEAITRALALPFPGPVVGMVLLLGAQPSAPIAAAAEMLLAHLSLLFVPVGVGVVTHLDVVAQYGVRLLVVVVVSTWIGMAVTGLVLRGLLGRETAGERRDG